MQTTVTVVITCFIRNTTTEWSLMQFRADPVPIVAALIALRSRWSGDADTGMIVLLLLILMMKIIDHWHIPDRASLIGARYVIHEGAHPVSDITLRKNRHPQFGFSLFNSCSHVSVSCHGTSRTVWRRS